jgi:hypothetical protein
LEGRLDAVMQMQSTPYDLAEELIRSFHR